MADKCPFKVGDYVIYKPSLRGYGLQEGDFLVPGRAYRIERVDKEAYLVIEGEHHPGGGLYWTEFEKASDTEVT